MNDVKQKHQQKNVEKKIQEETLKKEGEYIASVMGDKKYDWRKKLNEGMTSSGVFFTTLPATGDLTISSNDFSDEDTSLFNSYLSGNEVIMKHGIDGVDPTIVGGGWTIFRSVTTAKIDATKSTNITISVNKPESYYSSWQDRNPIENFNDNISVVIYSYRDPIETSMFLSTNFNGTQSFTIPKNLRVNDLRVQFAQFALSWIDENSPETGTLDASISVITTQRLTPVSVFVPLDSPEATAFIRTDPILSNLSPQERQQKLKEMLEASDEYVMKMLGLDFPGTGAVPPGEFDPFAQTPPGESGDIPGVDIQDFQIASEPLRGQKTDVKYDPKMKMFVPRPSDKDSGILIQNLIKQANKNQKQTAMVAHHEPEGQLISEKKLKSPQEILNKIPGYYDGKPAPLGFPVEPPPKMVNGMHPDLVDGKKVADRFNRLDPESAKVMPPTGNQHIDKKVKAARKQPK